MTDTYENEVGPEMQSRIVSITGDIRQARNTLEKLCAVINDKAVEVLGHEPATLAVGQQTSAGSGVSAKPGSLEVLRAEARTLTVATDRAVEAFNRFRGL